MSEFQFSTAPTALDYCRRIVNAMVRLFDIDHEEAIGRVNRQWKNARFETDDEVHTLTHETSEFWANDIYYGPDSRWWTADAQPRPRHYP